MKYSSWIMLFFLPALMLSLLPVASCSYRAEPAAGLPLTSAQLDAKPVFNVSELNAYPAQVGLNQPVSIQAIVTNTGGIEGKYTGHLLINGHAVESRAVLVSAGGSRLMEYSPILTSPGDNLISVGGRQIAVKVIEIRSTSTLQVDSGQIDGFDPIIGSTGRATAVIGTLDGHLIRYTAPHAGFQITGISIYGYIRDSSYDYDYDSAFGGPGLWVYGSGVATPEPITRNFTINIYTDRRELLFSREYPKEIFQPFPAWVQVDIPMIPVSGDFMVELQTHNPPRLFTWGAWDRDYWNRIVKHAWYYQVWVGYQNAIDVRSAVSQDGVILPDRWLTYNWLIRVEGL